MAEKYQMPSHLHLKYIYIVSLQESGLVILEANFLKILLEIRITNNDYFVLSLFQVHECKDSF